MSNIILGAPEGMEDQVQTIKGFRGGGYITIAMDLSEEEALALAERRTLWISFMDINPGGPAFFPPVRPDVMTPALVPFEELRISGRAADEGRLFVLSYLDINLIAMVVDPEERDHVMKSVMLSINGDAPEPMYELVCKTSAGDLEHQSKDYYFGEPLEVVGRFKEIREYAWLKIIFSNCPPDVLILRRKNKEAKAGQASLIQMASK